MGKPLEKVFKSFPNFNESNTTIMDHKACRLGGNPAQNLVIPTPFYVAKMHRLVDDKGSFKGCLWHLLQGLYGCEDIKHFQTHYPETVLDSIVNIKELFGMEAVSTNTEIVEGEGTCRG
jgi:hypothetical protein